MGRYGPGLDTQEQMDIILMPVVSRVRCQREERGPAVRTVRVGHGAEPVGDTRSPAFVSALGTRADRTSARRLSKHKATMLHLNIYFWIK